MPLAYGPATSKANYKVEDYNGQKASFNVSAADEATVKAGLDLINAITGAKVLEVDIATKEPVTGGFNDPLFGHQREYRAVFECVLADGTPGKLAIPAPVEGVLLATDKRYLDLTDASVAAFVTWLTTDTNGVTINKKAVTGVKQAYVSHKESSVQVERLKIG
jgi:hypothetical protein